VKFLLIPPLLAVFDALSPVANFQYPKDVRRDPVRTLRRPVELGSPKADMGRERLNPPPKADTPRAE
jgi:hypothetical protein